ncbi:DUF3489 domain-containing protein [Altererythrobacter xiamenensis]|nr:DUF3489 domain-containing protein [Altererythrobacter xiamenensis]
MPRPQSDKFGQTKISQVAKLMQRKSGATLEQMMQATGWQKHSVRAALTGLKKRGHVVERSVADGVSIYRLVNETNT